MGQHSNKSTPLRPKGERVIEGPMVKADLNKYKAQIKTEKTWKTSDHNSITIFKSENMRIVLIGMHQNALLKEHSTKAEISIQVIEGEITFTTEENHIKLTAGELVTLKSKIPHEIKANKESVFLLTLFLLPKSTN